ncbi:MAG TPA: transposase, partial [Hanamia sp.]|nr:transposase [Hanamia sp.]HUZ61918.1 transposase [Hanamia sp.]
AWFLPPYSPELNPAEMLWKHIRSNYFNNKCFETLDAVEEELCKALKDMYRAKKEMSSLTYFEWMK